jgi:hypothetical protein
MSDLVIRPGLPSDLPRLTEIYSYDAVKKSLPA